MPLQVVTPASEQLVGLDDVKTWLRVDHEADDSLIDRLIRSAHRQIEARTARTLCAQTLTLIRRDWGCHELLALPRPPLIEVDTVAYYDGGVLTELTEETDYLVVPSGERGVGAIAPIAGSPWPAPDDRPDAVQITYQAGHAAPADIPDDLITAAQIAIAEWYDNRRAGSLPPGAVELLALWQVLDHRVADSLRG